MHQNLYGKSNRLFALAFALVLLFTAAPVSYHGSDRFCSNVQEAYGAESKSITIYTTDSSALFPVYSYDTAFGLDTLVTPAYATAYSISWKSSDPDVASVDEHGHILGRLTGAYSSKASASCTITATCTWNGQTVSDSIRVKVKRGSDITGSYFFNSVSSGAALESTDADTDHDLIPEYLTDDLYNGSTGSPSVTADERSTSSADTDKMQDSIDRELEREHVEGEMIVVFEDRKNSSIRSTIREHDAVPEQITPIAGGSKAVLATAKSEDELKETMEKLAEDDQVAFVQPNYIYKLDSTEDIASYSGKDPYYDTDYQYFHKLMDTAGAWKLLDKNGISATTTVGIIDSGVDADHIDLKDNLILENGKYTRFTGSTSRKTDSDIIASGHGTHVAGIIGAVYGNGKGGAGVASGVNNDFCRILPVGVVEADGSLDTNAVINGINYAVKNGARVINMSFGSDYKDRAVARCIAGCYYNDNVVFVSSAGNKSSSDVSTERSNGTVRLECMNFPSDMKEVISVCNIDKSALKHEASYSGLAKDISAPGTNIYSTIPYNQLLASPYTYMSMSGTSMASPMVTGVAALMLDANPDLTPSEVRNIICAAACDSDDYYKKNEIGYGRIDARACVEAAYEAREHAQSDETDSEQQGAVTGGVLEDSEDSEAAKLGFSIKSYYSGEPEPYVVSKTVTKSKSKAISKVASFKAGTSGKKIRLTFGKATLTTTTTTETTNTYYTGSTDTTKKKSTKSTTSGLKYQIRIKNGSRTKYYRIKAASSSAANINVSVSGNKIRAYVKRFGGSGLKSGKTYTVSVRAYKTIDGETRYGKWSSKIKVKVK